MARKTEYEWVVEMIDEGECDRDAEHCDTYQDALEQAADIDPDRYAKAEIALVRRVYVDDMLDDQEWAYICDDGNLPGHFSDARDCEGAKVPQRYHREVAKSTANA